jgi:hypothetical protein
MAPAQAHADRGSTTTQQELNVVVLGALDVHVISSVRARPWLRRPPSPRLVRPLGGAALLTAAWYGMEHR